MQERCYLVIAGENGSWRRADGTCELCRHCGEAEGSMEVKSRGKAWA